MVDAPGVGRQRGRPEGDADDLRRRRRGGCRAGPAGPRRDGQDHHPRRSDRCRPGGQGRQPGDPRGDLPRRRRGHRPRDQGRARRRAGRRARSAGERRRAGSSPTGAAGCSPTTTRSGSRSRSTARTSASPSTSPAQLGAVLPVSALAAQLETGPHRRRPRRGRHVGARPSDPRALGARVLGATGAGTPISRDRPATSARRASRRSAA